MQEADKTESSTFKILFPIGVGIFMCLIVISVIQINNHNKKVDMGTTGLQVTQTNVAICPNCGTWGLPHCFNCGRVMQWDQTQGAYKCSPCQRVGTPYCPNCGTMMQQGGTIRPGAQVPGFARSPGVPNSNAILTA